MFGYFCKHYTNIQTMSFAKANTDRLPTFLGGGLDWHNTVGVQQTIKQPVQEYVKKPVLITSFLGYRKIKSRKNVAQVSSNEAVSVKMSSLSSPQNLSASAFVPPFHEN